MKKYYSLLFLITTFLSCDFGDDLTLDDIIDVNVLNGENGFLADTTTTISVEVKMDARASNEYRSVKLHTGAGHFREFASDTPSTGDTVTVDMRFNPVYTLTLIADTIAGSFVVYAQTSGTNPYTATDIVVLN